MSVLLWDDAIAGADHGEIRFYVFIEGIPLTLDDDYVTGLEQSASRLNLETRRGEGGQLTVRLQDDDDHTLATLFSPRQYRATFVSADVGDAGDIDVVGVGGLPSSGTVYIDGETITYTSIVGNTLTGCTRGAHASLAEAHFDGADVFLAPSFWEGRRVTLEAYLLPNFVAEGAPKTAATGLLTEIVGRFMLKEAPQHLGSDDDGADLWEITAVDLIEEYSQRKIGGGFTDVQIDNVAPSVNADGNFELVVGEDFNFNQFTVGTVLTYVKATTTEGAVVIAQLVQQVPAETIEFDRPSSWHDGTEIAQVRHIAIMHGAAAPLALYVLHSKLGDGTNGAYDQLPGHDAAAYGDSANRMGAGLTDDEVDDDAFIALERGINWNYPIDDEVDVGDFMFEWCIPMNACYFVNRSGKLTVRDLAEDGTASVMTVDTSIVDEDAPVTARYDEGSIYPRVRVECNYNLKTQKYELKENFVDAPLQKRFRRKEKSLELKSKGLFVDRNAASDADASGSFHRSGMTQQSLESMLRRVQAAEARGRTYVSLTCHFPILKAELGDIVTLNGIECTDRAGNLTLSSQPARIVSMRPRWDDGLVEVEFQLLEKLWRVAPACTITSRAGAVLTLNTADIGIPDAFPGKMFANTGVEVWDVSAGTKHQANVIAHTNTTITLDAAPAFANESNVDFVKIDSQTNGSGATSANGYVDSDFLYMMPDDENDGTAVEVTRWR